MKEKKTSANWYMAATHWLTAGFVIPLIFGLIIGIPLTIFLGKGDPLVLAVAFGLLTIITMWLGVMYSSKYLDKTYSITNASQIVILSTIYLAVIGGGFRILKFIQTGIFLSEYVSFVLGVIVFYIASKKYVKNNSSSSQPIESNMPVSGTTV